VALFFETLYPQLGLPTLSPALKLVSGVTVTTILWLLVTFLTPPETDETLVSFYKLVYPGGPGWKKIAAEALTGNGSESSGKGKETNLPLAIFCMLLGSFAVYSALFATGYFIYGLYGKAIIFSVIFIISTVWLTKKWKRLITA
jgi:hypothetical protein